MSRESYVLQVTREGAWRIVDVPAVGIPHPGPDPAEVEEMGHDPIVGALDVSPDSFDLDVQIETPADVVAKLDEAAGLEQDALDTKARAAFAFTTQPDSSSASSSISRARVMPGADSTTSSSGLS